MRQELAVLCALWAGILLPGTVCAQSISQDRAMSFGTFGIDPGITSGDIAVNLAGITSTSGAFFSLVDGDTGSYTVTGLPVSTAVTIMGSEVDPLDTPANAPSAVMPLTDFLFPASPVSDPSGVLVFDMGCTASTQVDSVNYNAGSYSGVVLVTVVVP